MQKMYNVKVGKRVVSTGNATYDEARTQALLLSKKYPGSELAIDQKVITDNGVDLGWNTVGSIRAAL